ncbi:MAG: hypothetical protein IT323_20790 [Anaerolineae bacterium]|nr:hypothetical protein [Anaerolineae bacterium]
MEWVVIAAAGLVIGLTIAFWQKIVAWANNVLAGWLGDLFGNELREAFLMLLAAGDRFIVIATRTAQRLQERIVHARLILRRLEGGQQHERVLQADLRKDDGALVHLEAAEVVPWHDLPDEVREKFIRRQADAVELELKVKG